MPVTAVVGANFGDEGKGRIVDALASEYDYVIRYQGGARDPSTIASVVTLLTVVAVVAAYLPARRAVRVNPIVALRYE